MTLELTHEQITAASAGAMVDELIYNEAQNEVVIIKYLQ